ncbi:Uncharacterized protein BP5553_08444 [Venustampulla echinocandica]|uniref:OPT superfamily oligopeptide transporter n=1 Tax=Venustampulla echinocandica TaxID=2656787 RepID=A0A370TE88_9HELO|nr:Uncharacterized protein BP5553_08444 [Venustampulla echinocandica]RDL33005.1 Uncharacterized protein BP5553_08444 [Venustampulla echinocandica]
MNSHSGDEEARPLLDQDAEDDRLLNSTSRGGSYTVPYPGPYAGFAWRSVLLGLAIGILVCLTNIHFGLQTGYINIMGMPSALIGFGIFQLLQKHLKLPFSAAENVLVQTVASSVGAMPATAGLVGVIPALEFLVPRPDGASSHPNLMRLCIWSLGTSIFGLVFAMTLRNRIILKEKLRFPTGTATAVTINVLHQEKSVPVPDLDATSDTVLEDRIEGSDAGYEHSPTISPYVGLRDISVAMGLSGVYTTISYFLPILHNIPIFGGVAASKWLWTFNLSFGYFGQGVITGHIVMINMLAGAIVGWGILSPLAKGMGWAPGLVRDWESGSRGWTIWISLAAMLADALVDLVWFVAQSALLYLKAQRGDVDHDGSAESESNFDLKKDSVLFSKFNWIWLTSGLLLSIAICIPAVAVSFGQFMPAPATLFSIVIALPLCVMGIKAVGTTDHNPASGIAKICQLIMGRIIPQSNPNAKLINLVAGGIAEAGAVQSGFMMQNLKTGYLSGSSPDTQFFGQVLGSLVGAIVSSMLYRLYTSVYSVPGDIFQVPSAYVWRAGASLAVGEGLPDHAPIFALITAIIFAAFSITRIVCGNSKYRHFIPMGIPFSVGMYNVPSFTLARALGALAQWYWTSRMKRSETPLMIFASGLILGEGLASILSLILEASHVPHL